MCKHDRTTIAQVTQDSERFLTTTQANQYLIERGFVCSKQWLTRSTAHSFSRWKVGAGYKWDKEELDTWLSEWSKGYRGKSGPNGHVSPRRLQRGRNLALSADDIKAVAEEVGSPWEKEVLTDSIIEFQEYKTEMGHPWTHPKGVKATLTLFKGQEYCFPVSVAYAITNETRGVYPKPWLAREDDQQAVQGLSEEDIEKARAELGL